MYIIKSIQINTINWYQKPFYISNYVEKQFTELSNSYISLLIYNNTNINYHNNRTTYTNDKYTHNDNTYNK